MRHHHSAALGLGLFCALAAGAASADETVLDRVTQLTRGIKWQPVAEVSIGFPTHHPQGMLKIGDHYFVSSVEIIRRTERFPELRDGYDRDAGEGKGHLFKIDAEGRLVDSVELGEGDVYHPGGIDFDGEAIWVPVAEYRPNSHAIIYRVDPETLEAVEVFRFADHIGGIVHDTDANSLHGVSWGSRRFYAWPLDADGAVSNADADPLDLRVANPAHYIDYQDCKYLARHQMLCSGLNNYQTAPETEPFRLGGLEVVDLERNQVTFQVPVELWSPKSGLPMTQNPVWIEASEAGLRGYFMPDDDESTLFIYEAALP